MRLKMTEDRRPGVVRKDRHGTPRHLSDVVAVTADTVADVLAEQAKWLKARQAAHDNLSRVVMEAVGELWDTDHRRLAQKLQSANHADHFNGL